MFDNSTSLPADTIVHSESRQNFLRDELQNHDYEILHCFWDGRNAAGELVAPGIYLLRLENENHASTRKIVILP